MGSNPYLRRLYHRSLQWSLSVAGYFDHVKSWVPSALEALPSIRRLGPIDAVVSTGPPASCHVIAGRLRRELRCRWIADFRDLWSDNPYNEHGWIRHSLETRLEKKTLRQADGLVVISPRWVELLGQRYQPTAASWIPNGFDPDEFPREAPPAPSDSFSITYTGTLYGGRRNPELLFAVVRELIDDTHVEMARKFAQVLERTA